MQTDLPCGPPGRPLRVLCVTDGVFPDARGGMGRFSAHLVRHLAEAGAQVDVCHPGPNRHWSRSSIGEFLVPMRKRRLPGHYLWETYHFSRRVKELIESQPDDYDVVYGQGLSLAAFPRRFPIPLVVNPHGLEMFQTRGWERPWRAAPFRRMMRRQLRRASLVVSLGGSLTDILKDECGLPASVIREVPNGVDLEYVDSLLPASAPRIARSLVVVGRLARNKGLLQLVRAVNARSDQDFKVEIVGEGEMAGHIERERRHPGIILRGAVEDDELFRAYAQAEALVFTGRGEGMPTVILEAMASSLLVIAADVGAVRTMVDSTNGILIRDGSVESVGAALDWFLQLSAEEKRRLGTESRRKVERSFAWPEVARSTLECLREAATADGRRPSFWARRRS